MPRRARKRSGLPWVVAIITIVVAAILAGLLLQEKVNDPYRTLQALDVKVYLENANSLRGNVYKIDAVIENQLAWSPERGRLFSIQVNEGRDSELLPLFVPANFNSLNIQKGQRFAIQLEVGENGLLHAKALTKS